MRLVPPDILRPISDSLVWIAVRVSAPGAGRHQSTAERRSGNCFGAPSTTVTAATFGQIATQANTPRRLESAIKLVW